MIKTSEIVKDLIKNNSDYLSEDGKILKTKLYEDIVKMKEDLIELLMSDENLKKLFFVKVKEVYVFDKQKFISFLEAKEFLPDSYTTFKNKIGLTDKRGNYLSNSNDVVISFPYKDCILEGGQTKDDQKREEIVYNEVLGYDEISRMLSPKIFTNAKRYTKDGIEENIEFTDNDNLIIKGNNLIALSSLLERYEGKIKCIYIDPPYNTGSDSFGYNDKFNHSTWLLFMKNRLELARKLLSEYGTIFISLDDKEAHYCKVLMDEIFGRENFIADICHKSRASVSNDKIISVSHNHLLFYAKNERNIFNIKKEYGISKDLSTFKEKDDKGYYKLVPVDGPGGASKGNPYYEFLGITKYWRFSKEKMQEMYDAGLIVKTGKNLQQKYYKSKAEGTRQTITTWWEEGLLTSSATTDLNKISETPFSNPKNESLLELIIEFATNENDIILDYHLGSGTTCAVAQKMGRKYIGIEQMDYIQEITIERMKNVLNGEQTGISKATNWNGGGSFVYCELLENAKFFIEEIHSATEDNILRIKEKIYSSDAIIPYLRKKDLKEVDNLFETLTLKDKKEILIKLIDKNKLYVNYSDIEDNTYNISEADKKFTNSFYKEVE